MIKSSLFVFSILAFLVASSVLPTSFIYASNDDDVDDSEYKFGRGNCGSGSCYARGVEDGKNNDFGDFFKIDPSGDCDAGEFLPRYYEGFIDGCMDAGNSRETCERFVE
jgi:hypothetical protein